MQVSQLPAVMRQVAEQSPGYEAVAAVLEALHPPLVWPGDLTGALVRSLGRQWALLLCQESANNKQHPLHLPQVSSSKPAAWPLTIKAMSGPVQPTRNLKPSCIGWTLICAFCRR